MNNLKFRAWHKETKKMYDISGIDFANEYAWLLNNEMYTRIYASKCELHEIELMQWTGLKDIYMGDIGIDEHGEIGYIAFGEHDVLPNAYGNSTAWGYHVQYKDKTRGLPHLAFDVIGNIFETPEYLDPKCAGVSRINVEEWGKND